MQQMSYNTNFDVENFYYSFVSILHIIRLLKYLPVLRKKGLIVQKYNVEKPLLINLDIRGYNVKRIFCYNGFYINFL